MTEDGVEIRRVDGRVLVTRQWPKRTMIDAAVIDGVRVTLQDDVIGIWVDNGYAQYSSKFVRHMELYDCELMDSRFDGVGS